MSDQKTERLINLTLALLATKRFLTKNEIFRIVAGYSGSIETMERMFERDKDELRKLSIEIEVRGIDPLFEDEQGYLIRSQTFHFSQDEFNQEELMILMMAANLWHDSALKENSKGALLKIQSFSGPIESNSISTPVIRDQESASMLSSAFDAVDAQMEVSFSYKGTSRTVKPYGLYTRDGFWYLVAEDKTEIKSFKLMRIEGSIIKSSTQPRFSKPENFDLSKYVSGTRNEEKLLARVLVRKEQAHTLRSKFLVDTYNEEWDLLSMPYVYEQELIETILWHGDNLIVISPLNLRRQIVSKLEQVKNG